MSDVQRSNVARILKECAHHAIQLGLVSAVSFFLDEDDKRYGIEVGAVTLKWRDIEQQFFTHQETFVKPELAVQWFVQQLTMK